MYILAHVGSVLAKHAKVGGDFEVSNDILSRPFEASRPTFTTKNGYQNTALGHTCQGVVLSKRAF